MLFMNRAFYYLLVQFGVGAVHSMAHICVRIPGVTITVTPNTDNNNITSSKHIKICAKLNLI